MNFKIKDMLKNKTFYKLLVEESIVFEKSKLKEIENHQVLVNEREWNVIKAMSTDQKEAVLGHLFFESMPKELKEKSLMKHYRFFDIADCAVIRTKAMKEYIIKNSDIAFLETGFVNVYEREIESIKNNDIHEDMADQLFLESKEKISELTKEISIKLLEVNGNIVLSEEGSKTAYLNAVIADHLEKGTSLSDSAKVFWVEIIHDFLESGELSGFEVEDLKFTYKNLNKTITTSYLDLVEENSDYIEAGVINLEFEEETEKFLKANTSFKTIEADMLIDLWFKMSNQNNEETIAKVNVFNKATQLSETYGCLTDYIELRNLTKDESVMQHIELKLSESIQESIEFDLLEGLPFSTYNSIESHIGLCYSDELFSTAIAKSPFSLLNSLDLKEKSISDMIRLDEDKDFKKAISNINTEFQRLSDEIPEEDFELDLDDIFFEDFCFEGKKTNEEVKKDLKKERRFIAFIVDSYIQNKKELIVESIKISEIEKYHGFFNIQNPEEIHNVLVFEYEHNNKREEIVYTSRFGMTDLEDCIYEEVDLEKECILINHFDKKPKLLGLEALSKITKK